MAVEAIWSNATEITFGLLFVSLFVWVMRKNDEREKEYRDSIDDKEKRMKDKNNIIATQQIFIAKQSETMQSISETVKETSETIRKVSEEIHDIKLKIEK